LIVKKVAAQCKLNAFARAHRANHLLKPWYSFKPCLAEQLSRNGAHNFNILAAHQFRGSVKFAALRFAECPRVPGSLFAGSRSVVYRIFIFCHGVLRVNRAVCIVFISCLHAHFAFSGKRCKRFLLKVKSNVTLLHTVHTVAAETFRLGARLKRIVVTRKQRKGVAASYRSKNARLRRIFGKEESVVFKNGIIYAIRAKQLFKALCPAHVRQPEPFAWIAKEMAVRIQACFYLRVDHFRKVCILRQECVCRRRRNKVYHIFWSEIFEFFKELLTVHFHKVNLVFLSLHETCLSLCKKRLVFIAPLKLRLAQRNATVNPFDVLVLNLCVIKQRAQWSRKHDAQLHRNVFAFKPWNHVEQRNIGICDCGEKNVVLRGEVHLWVAVMNIALLCDKYQDKIFLCHEIISPHYENDWRWLL